MLQQEDFERVIDKYKLWEDEVFYQELPEEISQEKEYDQMLDEVSKSYEAVPGSGTCSCIGARGLKENNPVEYRCGFADYTDTMREQYFEGPDETFYDPDKVKDTINSALDDRIELITEDQL